MNFIKHYRKYHATSEHKSLIMSARYFQAIKQFSSAIKGEVQSRITIISKERVKIPLQFGANMMKIG